VPFLSEFNHNSLGDFRFPEALALFTAEPNFLAGKVADFLVDCILPVKNTISQFCFDPLIFYDV
jgi:hypothetical protein